MRKPSPYYASYIALRGNMTIPWHSMNLTRFKSKPTSRMCELMVQAGKPHSPKSPSAKGSLLVSSSSEFLSTRGINVKVLTLVLDVFHSQLVSSLSTTIKSCYIIAWVLRTPRRYFSTLATIPGLLS